jgi:NADP-dependent 3-hydroxy acid dehydrogenase YdfG
MFKGQVAIITGAASGLGVAISTKLYGEGVRLALIDKNEKQLQQVVAKSFP